MITLCNALIRSDASQPVIIRMINIVKNTMQKKKGSELVQDKIQKQNTSSGRISYHHSLLIETEY